MLFIALLVFVVHFTLVILFANPFNAKIPSIAGRYVYPFFQQSWTMFAPAPSNNYRLFVEYDYNGLHKYDLFAEVNGLHQQNRLRGYEPLMLVFSNSIHYFEHATPLRKKLNGPVRNDLFFTMLEHSVLNYIREKHDSKISQVKIILCVLEAGGKQRVYFN